MKRTILVADDQEYTGKRLGDLLEMEYNVILAEDSLDVSKKFGEKVAELVERKEEVRHLPDGTIVTTVSYPLEGSPIYGERGIHGIVLDFDHPQQFMGHVIAMDLRRWDAGFTGPIVIRYNKSSTIDERLRECHRELDICLHDKSDGDQKVLDYLKSKLR